MLAWGCAPLTELCAWTLLDGSNYDMALLPCVQWIWK